MKNLKAECDNNLLFNKFNEILNIYEIVILSMLKYAKKKDISNIYINDNSKRF